MIFVRRMLDHMEVFWKDIPSPAQGNPNVRWFQLDWYIGLLRPHRSRFTLGIGGLFCSISIIEYGCLFIERLCHFTYITPKRLVTKSNEAIERIGLVRIS